MKKAFVSSFLFLVFICAPLPLSAQERSRVAIIPFTAVEAPESEARVVSSLFETAMVKTDVYNVIEQNQIKEILEAQAFSLSGCTDDSCAVEVGQLLAAELIILGELSRVGSRYIATAKVIDVALGKNVNADSVSAGSIEEMTESAVNLLAYKLAGLTYTEGSGERIADAFGEIFVLTTPEGAEIFVNGMRRGTSPLVVSKIPLGQVVINARKDNLAAEEVLRLETPELIETILELKISLGRLFIKSTEKDVEVFLDGRSLGPLGTGLFKDLSVGEHMLRLEGDGLLWEGEAVIAEEQTVTVEAYPRAYGTVRFEIPAGAVAQVKGRGVEKTLRGSGETDLPSGEYTVSYSGPDYISLEESFSLDRSGARSLVPSLSHTPSYLQRQKEAARTAALQDYTGETEALKERSAALGAGNLAGWTALRKDTEELFSLVVQGEHSFPGLEQELKELVTEVQASWFASRLKKIVAETEAGHIPFSEAIEKAAVLDRELAEYSGLPDRTGQAVTGFLIDSTRGRIEELSALIEAAEAKVPGRRAAKIAAFAAGAAGFALSGTAYFLGAEEFETYANASTTLTAAASREKLDLYAVLQTGGLIGGSAGALAGLFIPVKEKRLPGWEEERLQRAGELAALKGRM
ncbi:MAG: hypothetical protein JEY99_19455 [Spirochaetales bacterium]|nr:hypothetical protein [Spirochaetales bacterium]